MVRQFLAAGAILALASGWDTAVADSISEVEHARAKVRAGRPLTDRGAELLNRWGDQTGSRPYGGYPYGYYDDGYPDNRDDGYEDHPPPRWRRVPRYELD